jgi:outer membrane lipoprotein-sorting protein
VPVAVWYDGTTQWTYTADTKEVTIVEPTPEEIADINPFAIINGFRRGCEAKLVSSDKASDTVTLTPLSKASTVRQATITFSKASSLPTHIEIQLRAGGQMSLTITSANPNINYPASTFVFDKNKYPKATVVDLR